jgi:hypothetical protein
MAAHFDPIGLKAPDRGLLERADAALKTAHNTEKKLAALLRRALPSSGQTSTVAWACALEPAADDLADRAIARALLDDEPQPAILRQQTALAPNGKLSFGNR